MTTHRHAASGDALRERTGTTPGDEGNWRCNETTIPAEGVFAEMSRRHYAQVLGIGAGPANLSLAALAEPLDDLSVTLLESRDSVSWHPGLLWSSSRLQIDGAKDLVSLVDPRSEFSFMNFLHEEGRLYRHLIAAKEYVSRAEFDQYFAWAAARLDVRLDTGVISVNHDGKCFVVETSDGIWEAEDIVVGVGQVPYVPACAREAIGEGAWHAVDHLRYGLPVEGKHVLLVGGGQSSAEVALDLLSGRTGLPRALTWATGRKGLSPLDDSPFSNEWFNPAYVDYFFKLGEDQRKSLLASQKGAYFGISRDLLDRLYRRFYELDYLVQVSFVHRILTGFEMKNLSGRAGDFDAVLRDYVSGEEESVLCDLVVLGTGLARKVPSFFEPLIGAISCNGSSYEVSADFRVERRGGGRGRIYVQNAALETHGVADANISLAAWRSAKIINSILGKTHYRVDGDDIAHCL
ncbi:lysine N(6)-hydroxylase/L-ornithine N(5)-oxygenase family protein [Streptomyces sp. NPDC001220]